MSKAIRLRDQSQKSVVKLIDSLCGRYSRWEVWQDFIIMSAISISNVVDGSHRDSREKQYLDRAAKYSEKELETFSQMLAEVTNAMEQNPDQDFLGELFMALDLGNEWKGQFFTPYDVCRLMASMTYNNDLKQQITQKGWVSVSDPACGAGALLIAFANECRRPGHEINYQTSVLFVAQDVDFLAGCMCYIQLSLMGCPGYVVIDDTLSRPSTSIDARGLIPHDGPNIWYTPMYFRTEWHWRRIWAMANLMIRTAAPNSQAEAPASEPSDTNGPNVSEGKSGQLTLF